MSTHIWNESSEEWKVQPRCHFVPGPRVRSTKIISLMEFMFVRNVTMNCLTAKQSSNMILPGRHFHSPSTADLWRRFLRTRTLWRLSAASARTGWGTSSWGRDPRQDSPGFEFSATLSSLSPPRKLWRTRRRASKRYKSRMEKMKERWWSAPPDQSKLQI